VKGANLLFLLLNPSLIPDLGTAARHAVKNGTWE
jgi:hypothetical protein